MKSLNPWILKAVHRQPGISIAWEQTLRLAQDTGGLNQNLYLTSPWGLVCTFIGEALPPSVWAAGS